MHYLIRLRTEGDKSVERLGNRADVLITPKGDQSWAILEADDEETVRRELEGLEIEESQPVLPLDEYAAIMDARKGLEETKSRFVDDPSGALAEARRQVGLALEKRGYPPPERANNTSRHRQRILRDYERTEASESASVEEKRKAFNALWELLDRSARV